MYNNEFGILFHLLQVFWTKYESEFLLGYEDGSEVVGISQEDMEFCLDVDANKSSINLRECVHCGGGDGKDVSTEEQSEEEPLGRS